MKVQGVLAAIKTTVGGLNNQMRRMEIIADNIANAEKTPNKNGEVYKRKILSSDNSMKKNRFSQELQLKMNRTDKNHLHLGSGRLNKNDRSNGYEVIEQDSELLVFEPNHPMADENGYIKKPDINLVEEMIDLISTTRIYEANVTVINAAKNIAKKSLEI